MVQEAMPGGGPAATAPADDARSVLTRAFLLLDTFASRDRPLAISEIARRSGMAKTTAHRLAGQLVAIGALERAGERYRLGVRLFELGHLVPLARSLRETAMPFMQELWEASHETVHLGVVDGLDVLYVAKLASLQGCPVPTMPGRRMPLHATGLGKALLAASHPSLLDNVCRGPLAQLTPRTICEAPRLRAAIERVRVERVAYDLGESAPGLVCVAAPVEWDGHQAAALSVSAQAGRIDLRLLAPVLRRTGAALGRALSRHAA